MRMSLSEYLAPLVGRMAFGWFFLSQVVLYGGDWDKTVLKMMVAGIPSAPFVLAVTLFMLVLGSLSLILGFFARYGALLLFAVTIVAAVLLHNYWQIGDNPVLRQTEYELFGCNVAIAGGLLLLVGQGAGPFAVDNRQAKGRK